MIPKDEQLKMIQWLDETKKLGQNAVLKLGIKVQDYDQRIGTVIEINKPTSEYGTVLIKWQDSTETVYSYNNIFEVLRVV